MLEYIIILLICIIYSIISNLILRWTYFHLQGLFCKHIIYLISFIWPVSIPIIISILTILLVFAELYTLYIKVIKMLK
jgi:hypothetical protein